ncbi:MAG: DUF1559 domain-containing protein, partial [Patescibacteria group bacterium]|nr:DUF1559 domain-containing protein [Patescibacteria group bacterium]
AREAARRTTCVNNQKQISLAMLNFESSRRHFPGWRNKLAAGSTRYATWHVMLMPYLDRNDLWKDWTEWAEGEISTAPTPFLRLLVCPSNPPLTSAANNPANAYVVNTGMIGQDVNNMTRETTTAGANRLNDPRWGICHDAVASDVVVSLDYISQHDGAATTLLLSEDLDAQRWIYGISEGGNRTDADYYSRTENDGFRRIGFVWEGESWKGITVPPNSGAPATPLPVPTRPGARKYMSSNHGGGSVAFFADGHFQFIRDTIDYTVYQAIMTPNGRDRINGGVRVERGKVSDGNF